MSTPRRFLSAGIGLVAAALVLVERTGRAVEPMQASPALYGYRIINTYPHDPLAFTQGLLFREGFLYESTGQYGTSGVRKVRLEDGHVVKQVMLEKRFFGEGITDWGNDIFQLTWKDGMAFRFDRDSLKHEETFGYAGEGWGLTRDFEKLIISDGSAVLRFLNPKNMKEIGRVTVTEAGNPVPRLNELEFVKGEIFANVWLTDRIARIDPSSGKITGWIDLTGILPEGKPSNPDAVLNGIAYDAIGDRLFVTGKMWPRLFEIQLLKR